MTQPKCSICNRVMVEGPTINEHHLVPKTHGNRDKRARERDNLVVIHKICHDKIHSTFSEYDLTNYYHTIDRLVEHSEMQKFIKWVRKKNPKFVDTHKDTKERKRKRRR